ncbi:MAG: DUF3108 domain-containing protein [Burkholderiales bacterium]|nr:DUF3108 domain-containing protein [Burkholderiales bacterium]
MERLRLVRNRWWLLAIAAVIAAVHIWLTSSVSELMRQLDPKEKSSIQRMEATYVSELKLSAPPVATPTAPKSATTVTSAQRHAAPRRHKPRRPPVARKASAPKLPPSQAEVASPAETTASAVVAPTEETSASTPVTAVASAATPGGSEAGSATAAASAPTTSGPAFVWPLATRVSYKMDGYFRGEVHGSATVEWVRKDQRYQVRVEALIGPRFAPVGSWSLISEGTITPDGLSPERFEQIDRLLFRTSPPRTVSFEATEVVLGAGERVPRLPGMQDAASQLIQLAYRFMLNPSLLRPGNVIEIPLALLKRSETVAYHVVNEEVLPTPIGDIPTLHVKPERQNQTGGVLASEIWFAPGLQYLPVRIVAHGKENSYMDMRLVRAPEQTVTPPEPPPSAPQN